MRHCVSSTTLAKCAALDPTYRREHTFFRSFLMTTHSTTYASCNLPSVLRLTILSAAHRCPRIYVRSPAIFCRHSPEPRIVYRAASNISDCAREACIFRACRLIQPRRHVPEPHDADAALRRSYGHRDALSYGALPFHSAHPGASIFLFDLRHRKIWTQKR